MKKRSYKNRKLILIMIIIVITLILIFAFMNISYFTGFAIFEKIFNPVFLASSVGRLFISINFDLYIDSPGNTTYNYALNASYPIYLNVSSNRNVTAGNYTLVDMKHN